jgi:capsular polysaccharide transport system permease protein
MKSTVSSLLGSLGGSSKTGKDAYVIASFIRSQAIVAELDRDGALRKMFGGGAIDPLSRFDASASAERLRQYWSDKVNVSVDRLSRMITLQVSAFRPEDGVQLARDIIRLSEGVVNTLTERRRRDTVRIAEAELGEAEGRYMKALLALKEFRAAESTPDHARSIEMSAKMLLELESERIGLQTQRAALRQQLSQEASSLQPLEARIAAVDGQVDALKEQIASDRARARSAATSIARLEALEVERHFGQRVYEMAESALLRAREEAARQHEYLVVFLEPHAPERPSYKARYGIIGLVFTLALFTWALGALVVASVLDQRA